MEGPQTSRNADPRSKMFSNRMFLDSTLWVAFIFTCSKFLTSNLLHDRCYCPVPSDWPAHLQAGHVGQSAATRTSRHCQTGRIRCRTWVLHDADRPLLRVCNLPWLRQQHHGQPPLPSVAVAQRRQWHSMKSSIHAQPCS